MRILSYNIHKGIGGRDRRYDLQRVIDVIDAQEPDVICLQEVDRNVRRSGYDDQPAILAEHFRAQGVAFQLNHRVGQGGYGNLVLSRWPLSWHSDVSLKLKWRKSRAAIVAVVQSPDGPVKVVNQHLGLAETERRWQIRELLESEPLLREDNLPTAIVGDFNDWRDTLHRLELQAAGFLQATAPPRSFRSFPAFMPAGALDKAFVRGLEVAVAHVIRDGLARVASDHLPLVVDLSSARTPGSR